MKKRYLFVAIVLASALAKADAQQVVTSSGGYFTSENFSVSWTLGETVIETFSADNVILTQGFQQPYSFYLSQMLNIPAGWSGLSGYIDPLNKNVESIFSAHQSDFVILASMSGFYYPQAGVNTLGEWNAESGYQVKAENAIGVTLTGTIISNPEVDLIAGWNLIPVLTVCGATVDELFGTMPGLNIVKEVAGVNLYWPEYGIQTLENLVPGKAYWLNIDTEDSFTYPECTAKSGTYKSVAKPQDTSPWNEPHHAASSHVIAFPADVLKSIEISPGDYIGAFAAEDVCAGYVEIGETENGAGLVLFADDPTTAHKDGFAEGELVSFRWYKSGTMQEYSIEPEFDSSLPNSGFFAVQGLSAVKSVTLSAASIEESGHIAPTIHPNPSDGNFTLTMSHRPENLQILLFDTKGRVIDLTESAKLMNGGSIFFHLSYLPPGIYFLKLTNNHINRLMKVVVR